MEQAVQQGVILIVRKNRKEARKIYLEEAMNAFNYVLDELCHGTGSAANCDFDVEE